MSGLFERQGSSEYHGEEVSQLEHAYQAYILAGRQGADAELQIAAFLHDIGHLIGEEQHEFGAKDHDRVGADKLRAMGFSERVAQVAQHHVRAKRYLCYKSPSYHENLSLASKESLKLQGGPMQVAEAEEFERIPYFQEIVKARFWDDEAKDKDFDKPDLGLVMLEIENYLTSRNV
ncbi:HD domain-containing protein [Marinilongibacter aquaticus]|uniref:HD domain-containing protein n=1 Tax=Marinilongibacter aquaticus TaxID=2975157 RepID=UPI0021BDEB89|nr:HD domain-containing protein [Marinilongibacter aquaticus]UBM58108.1 HD domain-containing protein [Marinilongibacter aquaticus]